VAFNVKRALERAEKHAAKGHHDKAAREYQSVVDANPKDVRAWLMLADCLVRCGQRDKAIDRYLRVATFYADAKQPGKALAVYRQILNIDPSRLDIHTKVGKINQEMGRIADAVACYEAVAQAKLKAGHVQEALKVYELVAETDSRSLSKRLRLAELYSREKMLSQAVENFRIAARQLLAEEKYPDFIRVAERLIYHKEGDTQTLRELARAYMKTGEPRRALVKLNALLHVDQTDVEGLELLAEAFIALEKPEKAVRVVGELAREQKKRGAEGRQEALRVLKRGLEWDPDCEELVALRDEIERGEDGELGDVVEDIEELDDGDVEELDDDDVVLEELPDTDSTPLTDTVMSEVGEPSAPEAGPGAAGSGDVDKMLLEVQTYLKYRLFDHALGHLRMILDANPHHLGASELHAKVLAELGRKDEAAAAYAKVAAQVESRDPGLAEEHAKRAIEHVPGHTGAQALLSRMSSRGEPDETDFSGLDDAPLSGATDEPELGDFDDSGMFEMGDEDVAREQPEDSGGFELPPTLGLKDDDAAMFDELAASDSSEIDVRQDEPDFAIHLQESEQGDELEEPEPMSIEDRFGLSDDGEAEVETAESEEELLGVGEAVEDLLLGAEEAEEELLGAEEEEEELLGAEEPEEEVLAAEEPEEEVLAAEEPEEEVLAGRRGAGGGGAGRRGAGGGGSGVAGHRGRRRRDPFLHGAGHHGGCGAGIR
jgi:tetratricopeptide (TPR) repeat protein